MWGDIAWKCLSMGLKILDPHAKGQITDQRCKGTANTHRYIKNSQRAFSVMTSTNLAYDRRVGRNFNQTAQRWRSNNCFQRSTSGKHPRTAGTQRYWNESQKLRRHSKQHNLLRQLRKHAICVEEGNTRWHMSPNHIEPFSPLAPWSQVTFSGQVLKDKFGQVYLTIDNYSIDEQINLRINPSYLRDFMPPIELPDEGHQCHGKKLRRNIQADEVDDIDLFDFASLSRIGTD